jgi:hypothetical protein
MPALLKEILPEGTYLTNSDKGRVRKTFPLTYLQKLAQTANEMIDKGLRIPAPFDHSKAATPVQVDASPASAYQNAGYWTHFTVKSDDNGKNVLVGIADIPGSKNDPNSPYYKALNSAKDVSLSIREEYVDGLGRTWKDAILHGALVNHPVVPGQADFIEIPDGAQVYNMSMLETETDEDYVEPGLIENVRSALKEACEIVLPASNKASVFLRDLLVAASQIKASRPVDGQELQPVPIYMSTTGDESMPLSKEQAEALVNTKAVNPVTNKPFTMEDLGFKPAATTDMSALQAQLAEKDAKIAKATTLIQALVNKVISDAKTSIQGRINKLISNGVITKEYAEANLTPRVDFQMSTLSDGTMAPHPLEVTLSALEQLPVKHATPAAPSFFDGVVQPAPYASAVEMSPEEMDKAINEFVEMV